jgi:hypothetical protein
VQQLKRKRGMAMQMPQRRASNESDSRLAIA